MIVVMKRGATEDEIQGAINRVKELGCTEHLMRGVERTVIAALGDERGKNMAEALHCYREAIKRQPDYALAHAGVGTVLLVRDDVDGAMSAFQQALHHRPRTGPAHSGVGQCLGALHCRNSGFLVLCHEQADVAGLHRRYGNDGYGDEENQRHNKNGALLPCW